MGKNEEKRCSDAVQAAMDVIGSKWAYSVITQLYYRPQRFNELRRNVGDISVKSLTDRLRDMERQKIVNRTVIPTIPISVEYSLTEKGREYREILLQMRKWGDKWLPEEQED